MALTIVLTMGDEEFHLRGITLKELLVVKQWTGLPNKQAWVNAINADDPEALRAALGIAMWRRAKAEKPDAPKPRLDELDYDTDTQSTRLVDDTGRAVELVFETKADGSLKLDKDDSPIIARDKDGSAQLRYVDTGEPVPPTATP